MNAYSIKKISVITGLFLLAATGKSVAFTNTEAETESDSSAIRAELRMLDSLIFQAPTITIPSYKVSTEAEENPVDKSIDDWVNNQRKVFNAHTGLSLSMTYYHRFGSSGGDYAYDEVSSYRNRFQATLSWDIMKSSLIGRKLAHERAILLGELKRNSFTKQDFSTRQIEITEAVVEELSSSYNYLIACKKELLSTKFRVQQSLKDASKILDGDMALVQQQIVLLNGMVKPHSGEKQGIFDVQDYLGLQHHMDSVTIKTIVQNDFEQKKLELEYYLLENEKSSSKYVRGIKVAPFVRGNLYANNRFTDNRNNLDVGITVSLPLDNVSGAKRREISSQMELNQHLVQNNQSKLTHRYEQLTKDLNQNLVVLTSYVDALEHVKNRLFSAKKLFSIQKIYFYQLLDEYIKYVDMMISIHDQIEKRELMLIELNNISGN
ncbi:hypothetical protein LJC62_00680 [Odoribacter sp. OttesenSCG-928-A06]|nr:hypothetical protein [Odoribacter sp. OttesenSCG-928-A06]